MIRNKFQLCFSRSLIFDVRRYRMITFLYPPHWYSGTESRCLVNTISVSPDKGCVHRTEKQTHFSRADFIPCLIRLLRPLYLQLKRFTANDKENSHLRGGNSTRRQCISGKYWSVWLTTGNRNLNKIISIPHFFRSNNKYNLSAASKVNQS
jgi:hypothetical protein